MKFNYATKLNSCFLIFFLAFINNSFAQNLQGSHAYCDMLAGKSSQLSTSKHLDNVPVLNNPLLNAPVLNKSVANYTTIFNTDFTSAGVGAMRTHGTGQITLAGVSGTVTLAYLYWHGETNSSVDVGNIITVNGNPVLGTNIGVSSDNCWGFSNSQGYRADVTALVQVTGNGVYTLAGFGAMDPNGASLIVFFNDGNNTNNRDVVIFDGNDSNIFFGGIPGNPNAPADPAGWNVTLSGINYVSGTGNIQLHVADGQIFTDDALRVNSVVIAPAGSVFDGNTVPGVDNGPSGNGRLWDIRTFDVTSFLSPGPNTLNLTTGAGGSDCLGLIVALIDLPAGAAPPPVCTVTPACKSATVTLVNGSATVTAADIDNGSTASCGIKSMSVSPSTFTCADIGEHQVTLTVTDNNDNTSTCTSTVTVVGAIPSCSITSVPSSNVYTGGVPTNIYLGYGPQSTTLQVSPSGGTSFTYSWSPTTGLSNPTSGAPVFTPTAAGNYTFTVTVTNENGCTSTCSITICVLDIRVPGFTNKVYVCHKTGNGSTQTLAISVDAVPAHIWMPGHGDYLGKCGQTPCGASRTAPVETIVNIDNVQGLNVAVLPNPSNGAFNLTIRSNEKSPVTVSVVSIVGQVVSKQTNVQPNGTIRFGEKLAPGTYYVEVKQGGQTSLVKLVKVE